MDDKKTAEILMKLIQKDILEDNEKEAIRAAIGILTWTQLAKSRIKKQQEKIKKSTEWD
ncbi:MAG: hypothetical protein WCK11_02490 [Candidatus Falkowbacteria bacterium]